MGGDNDGQIGSIASRLNQIQFSSPRKAGIKGDDLDAVLEFARTDAVLSPMLETILQAHQEWLRFVGG